MLPLDVPIFIAIDSIDLRWSFDILAGVVRERLGEDARSGALFIFFGRRHDRCKALFYDKTGFCILYKRLERGTFRMPEVIEPGATHVMIDDAELALLLEGLELPKASRAKRYRTH